MKLTVISRGTIEFDGEDFYVKDVFGKLLVDLSLTFQEVILCASVYPRKSAYESYCHFCLRGKKISVLELPKDKDENAGIIKRIWRNVKCVWVITRHIKQWGMIYLFLPNYQSVITYFINKLYGHRPFWVYVGADWEAISHYTWRWNQGPKKLLLPVYKKVNRCFEYIVMRGSKLILVSGKALKNKYKNKIKGKIIETQPEINFRKENIYFREDTCQGHIIKCLFVGSINQWKGLEYLIRAIPLIKEKIVLWIVGPANKEYKNILVNLINDFNLNERVKFKGYIPNGPDLITIYRECDIFILPTLSEGFPRVLYEAMSQSLPIITTDAGGIKGLMKHEENALIIPPKSEDVIAEAVKNIIRDTKKRKHLIKKGLETIEPIFEIDQITQIRQLLKIYFPNEYIMLKIHKF